MPDEELDETEKASLDIWRQRMSDEPNLPANWREGIYRGMVEQLRAEKPGLRSLPTNLVMKMMFTESSYDPRKIGSAGEVGLMQLKPGDADWFAGKRKSLGPVQNLADPKENITRGMSYLKYLIKKTGSTEAGVESYNVGLTAYNEGKRNPDYVRKVLTRGMR
uniref:Putative transglycosylase n=1 Tax=viral metagenome TaxID=1070528 RepID=A0A6M3KXB7_9ZZZZ